MKNHDNYSTQMELDVALPFYHGRLACQTAVDRLGTISAPGAFLIRFNSRHDMIGDYIISYLDDKLDIRHIVINLSRDTNLRKCNPHITNIRTAIEVLLSLDPKKFAYGVPWQNFDTIPKINLRRISDPNQCDICDCTFEKNDEKSRNTHRKSHLVTYCDICLGLIAHNSYYNHRNVCLNKKFQCLRCSYSTKRQDGLKRHIYKQHTLATIECDSCDEMFPTILSKDMHMKKLHGYLRFLCPHCKKGFKTNYYLNRHIACHQRIKQKQEGKNRGKLSQKINCDECEFSTVHPKNLTRHKKTHSLTVVSF